MGNVIKNLEKYLSEIKKKLPDVEQRLNAGADEKQFAEVSGKLNCELPQAFIDLYRRFDGDEASKCVSFMAGFEFLSLERVLFQLECFEDMEDDLTAVKTRAIREAPINELNWLPIAYDCSRAWLVMDLSPAEAGTFGQIIAVDYDFNYCYLLADSLDELFGKMAEWFEKGILTINTEDYEEPFIMEHTGHLLNSVEKLAILDGTEDETEIALPEGFWQQYFGQKASISIKELEKEKRMMISEETIDCSPFAYMSNLKELIIHDSVLSNLSALAKAPQIKKMIFARCTFGGESLAALSEAPNLKELGLNVMLADGLSELQKSKTLRCLQLREVSGFCVEDLGKFTQLQELCLETMDLHDGAFVGKMKKLKKLDLGKHTLDHLDFLQDLPNLTEFNLSEPAQDEAGLSAVGGMSKLKRFIYPVKDLSVYQGCTSLEEVGIAAGVSNGFEVFQGSKLRGFSVIGSVSKEYAEDVLKQMDQYAKIYSYSIKTC